jgi:hypothetical protein
MRNTSGLPPKDAAFSQGPCPFARAKRCGDLQQPRVVPPPGLDRGQEVVFHAPGGDAAR